ncbi:spermatogenesis-associated protein 31D4-like [Diceros bicornis minor]|uniref:spermatogenesis-associated protein 31D4-like n=1 Tax=Diceros bicornis minor TaxID=77932 RepID=UPI0026EC625E|nr:spermatogenesis-associated protein 31D4-like [Diceros bicornis minor]
MQFNQWNVLSFLNSPFESCLSFGSMFLNTDPNLTFLCGLGLLLLFLCYLVGIPTLPTFWKTKVFQERQGRAKRRRKGGTSRGWRHYQRETEEKKRLISIMKSLPGQHHNTTHIRQLLCPDSFCEVCNSTTAEVNRLLFLEDLEDDTLSVSSLASTASETESLFTASSAFSEVPPGDLIPDPLHEPSPAPPSTLLPNPMTPLADFLSPLPPGHSLPPEPFPPLDSKLPADHSTCQAFAFSPLPPHDTQTVDPVLQPKATLSLHTIFSVDSELAQDVSLLPHLSQTMNPTDSLACHHIPPTLSVSPPPDHPSTVSQSKLISTLLKTVQENSSPDSPGGLSTCIPTIKGTDHSSLSVSEFSSWQAHAKDLFPSILAQRDVNQEFLAPHSSEAFFGGDPATNLVEPGNLSFLSPDVLALLERQVQKRSDFLMWEEKKRVSFPKELRPDYQLNSSGKMLEGIADKHDLAVSLPFWSSKGKPKELHVHQQPPYPKTSEDHLQQKHIQLFWGLPSLHSEYLPSVDHVSGDCSSIFIFTAIFNASTGQEFPVLSHPIPLSLPEIQPQSLPQTLPQSQALPVTQVQPQAHLQSPLPILPSGPLPKTEICGVCFQRPQNEPESLIISEMQHLEWNVLQKQQESLWGLPSVVQRSQEEFCPSVPNSPYLRASKAHVSVSILPREFPLSDELRKKLEHHLRKRLIQHRWGLPRRIHESLSLMMPPTNFAEMPELESDHGLSWVSVNKNLNVGLSHPGSFHERGSEMLHLEKDVGKDQGHTSENGPKALLLSGPERSSDKDLGCDSEKDLNSHMASLSGKNSRASVGSLGHKQLENVLKVHLSKKFEEINEGRLPGTVHGSRHAIKQTLLLSDKSHTQIKQRSLPPSLGGDHSLNTFQELSFIDSSAQQMLEAHIKRFRMRMLWGLPRRVLESIEISKLKDAASQSLSSSHFASSTNLISDGDSKSGGFKPIRGSSKSLHGDKVGTTNLAPVLDHPLPATSPVGKKGQGTPRQSPSGINQELAEDVQRSKGATQTLLPVTHGITGKASQRQTRLCNRCPPRLPARRAGARQEPEEKRVSSRDGVETRQAKKMEESEPFSELNTSREIFRAKELDALQSKTGDTLTTSKPGSSQMINVNESKVETTETTESAPPKRSVPRDPKSSYLKEQLLSELKSKLEKREQSQAQGQRTDRPLPSESLTYKASLTHAQGVCSRDAGASQVLHVHLEDRGIGVEQRQEPWVPKHVLRWSQDKNFPPAAERVSPPGPKAEERGGGDAELGTSQPRRKSFPNQDMALQETLGSKPSQTPSQKGQPPPESLFRKKMNHFLQWLHPTIKCKRQENSQEKGSPISSEQSRGLVKRRAAVTGMTTAQKVMTDTGKFPEEKLGRWHVIDTTCPREPLPSPRKFEKTQQKAAVQARAEPIQGHPSSYRAPSCKVTNTKSCHQEAVFAGQSYPSVRWSRDEDRHPEKVVAFKDQLLCQKHPSSVPRREPVPHPGPTCRRQDNQGPPATLTTAEGTVLRDLSLLFQQKMLLQNFQRGKFPTPK